MNRWTSQPLIIPAAVCIHYSESDECLQAVGRYTSSGSNCCSSMRFILCRLFRHICLQGPTHSSEIVVNHCAHHLTQWQRALIDACYCRPTVLLIRELRLHHLALSGRAAVPAQPWLPANIAMIWSWLHMLLNWKMHVRLCKQHGHECQGPATC